MRWTKSGKRGTPRTAVGERPLVFEQVWVGKDLAIWGERLGKDWERLGVLGERLGLGSSRTVGKQVRRGERLPFEDFLYINKRSGRGSEVGSENSFCSSRVTLPLELYTHWRFSRTLSPAPSKGFTF